MPAALSLVEYSVTLLSHKARCSNCASPENFITLAWSAGVNLSQVTLDMTKISGMIKCVVWV